MSLERWRLRKGRHSAACFETPHPLGVELRVVVGADDLRRSEVFRDPAAAIATAADWRALFEARGWHAPESRYTRVALERALALTENARRRVSSDSGMGHVLGYRLKAMQEALEVMLDPALSLDAPSRERRLDEAWRELARAERGPDGRALVAPILEALTARASDAPARAREHADV